MTGATTIIMHSRARLHAIAFLALLAFVPQAALAQPEPPGISTLASVNTQWTEQQRRTVREYVEHWAAEIATEDADRSRLAKRRLLDPLNAPGMVPLFREEYGRVAVPELTKLVASSSAFAAVNGVQIIAEIATDASLSVLRERLDPQREPREAVRLSAVQGLRSVQRVGVASQRTLELTLRDLVRAAERETSWLVLRRGFESLAVGGTALTRELQTELLKAVLDKIEASGEDTGLMQAVHRGVSLMRDQFIAMTNAADQRAFGVAAAPQLGRVLELALANWETARSAPSHVKASYDSAVQLSEQLLRFIDERVRSQQPPRDLLVAGWNSGNRTAYTERLQHWQTVLNAAPYATRR
ncbi:MAG TPA: hypothetical protein PK400_09350 [Phycisphaerales bacterium]|nr:hypothetical protein [Phycisphaerales bacterium]HRQ75791.1 hypothetical protein [Phycisphaerales bacterium]